MARRSLALSLALAVLALSPIHAEAPPLARLANARLSVAFDLERGVYSVIGADGAPLLRDAHYTVGAWSSNAPGTKHSAQERAVADALGKGRALLVRSVRPGQPTLLLEIALYRDHPFVCLRCGVENTLREPLHLKEYHPLVGGRAFPDAVVADAKTLDGQSGAQQTAVKSGAYRGSPNNVLLTFRDRGARRSLVMGGLTYHEFMKWAAVGPTPGSLTSAPRAAELAARGKAAGGGLAAYLDCGAATESGTAGPRLAAMQGQPWSSDGTSHDAAFHSLLFDNREVVLEASGLDPAKEYALGFSWWDFSGDGRVESVYATGGDGVRRPLVDKKALPDYRGKRQGPEQLAFALPREAYASGKVRLSFTRDAAKDGSNAVVSEAWLWEGSVDIARALGAPPAAAPTEGNALFADLRAADPVGKRVDPGGRWLGDDRFYLDLLTPDPFEALERYGKSVRAAQGARPNPYDFPTVCAWYAGVWKTAGAQNHPDKSKYRIATTSGLVEEAEQMRRSGFLRYSRAAARLVPDNYTADNPQGWWDDEHWRQQGFYIAPYDTSQKWGKAMQERGVLPFTYFQCDRVSADYAKAFPQLVLHGAVDWTHPEARARLRRVYAAMRGAVSGMMFDYCDEIWGNHAARGGFHDPYATAASVYRSVFALAKEGLGPNSWLHERCLGQPNSDMAVGLTDSQRTSGDTDRIDPAMVSRSGLRWYKNRVLFSYDMDSKEIFSSWKGGGFAGTDEDGRRMMLTLAYVAASRLLLANSFREMPPDVLRDLERTFPYPTEARSARPVDAFTAESWPRVYDFAVSPAWHQLTLFNLDGRSPGEFAVPLSAPNVDGGLGLDASASYYAYDFWNDTFAGELKGSELLKQTLRAGEARMLSLHRVQAFPQLLSTNRHLMQGTLDLSGRPRWDAKTGTLTGASRVVGGESYRVVLAGNGFRAVSASAQGATAKVAPLPGGEGLVALSLDTPRNAEVAWKVFFRR